MGKNFNELLKRGHRKFYVTITSSYENPVFYKKDGEPSPKEKIVKEFDFSTTYSRPSVDPQITWSHGLESFGDSVLPSYLIGLTMSI